MIDQLDGTTGALVVLAGENVVEQDVVRAL
jgi:hypothetical protein